MEGFAALPAELVQLIFKAPQLEEFESREHIDWLKFRLRGLAVCRSWRRALSQLPLETVRVDYDLEGRGTAVQSAIVRWLICQQPRVEQLVLNCVQVFGVGRSHSETDLGLLAAVVHSVPRKELKVLRYCLGHQCLSEALPFPAALSSLQELRLQSLGWDEEWLAQLAALPALRILELRPLWPANGFVGDPMVLPRLPQITQLVMLSEWDGIATRVLLSDLPALKVLDLRLYGSLEIVAASRSGGGSSRGSSRKGSPGQLPSGITHLALDVEQECRMDFGTLPALRLAQLDCPRLHGAATLARCTQLRELRLGKDEKWDSGDYESLGAWAVELLEHAPQQLSKLTLVGEWGKEVAAALGALGQLQTLSFFSAFRQPSPPATAPVWRGLRAFLLDCSEEPARVPAGLRQAKLLERLKLEEDRPSQATLKLLASLPCLRHLWLEPSGWDDSCLCKMRPLLDPAVERAVRKALPRLVSLSVKGWEDIA